MVAQSDGGTRSAILDATRERLLTDGYASLSTRKVAAEAGVPLSQLHYHFGSKNQLILALLDVENQRRLDRQRTMYAEANVPLWQRYEHACDYLEDDLESGYVRVLQEMIAAGWSEPSLGAAVRNLLAGWYELLTDVFAQAEAEHGRLGPFTAAEAASLVGAIFLGSEAMLLLGFERQQMPIRSSLRRLGQLFRSWEDAQSATNRKSSG
ncbi:MAG: TetR/AcrR family transcriptional regulator [Geodermatophilaceae bacterium]|jgi:AcrR family transcriptional regulator